MAAPYKKWVPATAVSGAMFSATVSAALRHTYSRALFESVRAKQRELGMQLRIVRHRYVCLYKTTWVKCMESCLKAIRVSRQPSKKEKKKKQQRKKGRLVCAKDYTFYIRIYGIIKMGTMAAKSVVWAAPCC